MAEKEARKVVTISLPAEVFKRVKEQADEEQRTMSGMVAFLLAKATTVNA